LRLGQGLAGPEVFGVDLSNSILGNGGVDALLDLATKPDLQAVVVLS
jgi:hypothetical protein